MAGSRIQTLEEKTQAFFSDIGRAGVLPPNVDPHDAAQGVFCVLTQRVTGGEAKEFSASMPSPLKDLLRQCTLHREEAPASFGRAEFVQKVADHFQISLDQAEALAHTVFAAMWANLPHKELDDVESQLPPDLKDLWRPRVAH